MKSELEFTRTEVLEFLPQYAAEIISEDDVVDGLNRILAEKLGKAKTVYGEIWSGNLGMLTTVRQIRSTVSGKLINIEELKP